MGKHLALKELRKRRPELREREFADADEQAQPEMRLLEEERNRQLYLALERIAPDYREVLMLQYMENMPPADIAQVTGKRVGQVYNLIKRGKQALRTELDRMGFEYAEPCTAKNGGGTRMDLVLLEKLVLVLGVVLNTGVIVICARSLPLRRSMAPVFFTFARVSNLMSGLYWLAYDLLRQDTRMPFAANLFGEIGLFLLLAAALSAVFRGRFGAARRELFCTAFFAAASTALWIAWSGRWVEDVLVGLCFGYYLCVCVRSLKQGGVLSVREWRLLGCLAALLLVLQGLTFVLPEPWRTTADWMAYAVMFSVLAWLLVKLIRGLLLKREAAGLFALSISCSAWAVSTMYMSAGLFYLAAEVLWIVALPLSLIALRREEADA